MWEWQSTGGGRNMFDSITNMMDVVRQQGIFTQQPEDRCTKGVKAVRRLYRQAYLAFAARVGNSASA